MKMGTTASPWRYDVGRQPAASAYVHRQNHSHVLRQQNVPGAAVTALETAGTTPFGSGWQAPGTTDPDALARAARPDECGSDGGSRSSSGAALNT
jgi:hypothetical protein